MKEIFISYRSADLENGCIQVYQLLVEEFGRDEIIFAHSNFKTGTEWLPQIRAGIAGSRAIVLIIGKSWERQEDNAGTDQTDYLEEELKLASKLKIPIIPICIGVNSKNLKGILPPKFEWIHKIHALNFDINKSSNPEFIKELFEILFKLKIRQEKSQSNLVETALKWISLFASQVVRLCLNPVSATCRILVVSPKSVWLVIGELSFSLVILFLSMNASSQIEIDYSLLHFLYEAQSIGFYFLFFGGLIYCFSVYLNKQTYSFIQLVNISIHFLAASLICFSISTTLINFFMTDHNQAILLESFNNSSSLEHAIDTFIMQISNYEKILFFLILAVSSYSMIWITSGIIRGISISHGFYRVWPVWLFVYILNLLLSAFLLFFNFKPSNLPLELNWYYGTDKVLEKSYTKAPFLITFKGNVILNENLFHINADEFSIENRETKDLKIEHVWCGLGLMENNQFQWFRPSYEGYVKIDSIVNSNQKRHFKILTIKIPIPPDASSQNTIVSCFVYLNGMSYPLLGSQITFLKW